MTESHGEVAQRISRTWAANPSIQLDRERLAFLCGIHAFAERSPDPMLAEEQLRDIFALLNDVMQGEVATVAQRATHAIDALTRQRLLVRSDLGGIATEGEFTLSPLGKSLAEWFGADERLTREGLEVMLTRIRGDLAGVRQAAAQGGDAAHWRTRVVAPLRLTVTGLVEMIDRRQRGMDVAQQETREKIGQLLEAQWFEAIAACESLLQGTSETLRELNRALMSEADGVGNLLNEIFEAADGAGQESAIEAVAHVRIQVERIGAWGESRFQAWSDYYRNVHDFIRTIVRVDRDRALRARLRDAIKGYAGAPWHLALAAQTPYRHLREPQPRQSGTGVARRRGERDHALADDAVQAGLLERLAGAWQTRLAETGRLDLRALLHELLPSRTDDELFLIAGELATWMLERGSPLPPDGWQWVRLGQRLELQNLVVVSEAAAGAPDG